MSAAAGARGKALEYRPPESDTQRLANLCGPLDAHLRQIAEAFDTRIQRRGELFLIEGAPASARAARAALEHFHDLAQRALSIDEIQLGLVELRAGARAEVAAATAAATATPDEPDTPVLHTRRADLQGRTPRQREYLRHILSHDITFGIGPAGTGKTYLAVACAVDAPGIGAQVIYVEDAFLGRAARPYAQRLLAVDSADGAARVREFAFIDPESAVGLCGQHARAVFRSNTVERTGCELVLRRNGARVEGAVEGSGCASRINDAHHVERALRSEDDAVELRERGVDEAGRVVWGDGAALRFTRR